MFEAISRLFRDKDAPATNPEPRLAVAALLIHLSAVDGSTSEAEREAVRHTLMDYYALNESEVDGVSARQRTLLRSQMSRGLA